VSKTRAEFAQCRLIDENETRKLGLSGLDQSFLNSVKELLLKTKDLARVIDLQVKNIYPEYLQE
jgi:hypothetical protein